MTYILGILSGIEFLVIIGLILALRADTHEEDLDQDDQNYNYLTDMNPGEIQEKYYLEILCALLSNSSITEKSTQEQIINQAKELSVIAYNTYYNDQD